jgi:hypothetical protein
MRSDPHSRALRLGRNRSSGIWFAVTTSLRDRHRVLDAAEGRLVIESLLWLRQHERAWVFAFVVMPDHVHALVAPGARGGALGDPCWVGESTWRASASAPRTEIVFLGLIHKAARAETRRDLLRSRLRTRWPQRASELRQGLCALFTMTKVGEQQVYWRRRVGLGKQHRLARVLGLEHPVTLPAQNLGGDPAHRVLDERDDLHPQNAKM